MFFLICLSLLLLSSSCDKGEEGCTIELSCNYNENAIINDGSCWDATEGCTCSDGEGATADCLAVCDINDENNAPDEDSDGICDVGVVGGCIDSTLCNYKPDATHNNNSCATDLSAFGGYENGTDCSGECNGLAVNDGCANTKCVGGTNIIGKSWRIKINSIVTFSLQNGMSMGSDANSVTLGTSIYAKDGYNGSELNEGQITCDDNEDGSDDDCYADALEPPVMNENQDNYIRFFFPHDDANEWDEWGSKVNFDIDDLDFDRDIRANDYHSIFTDGIGMNWYAEIETTLSDTVNVDSLKIEINYLEGVEQCTIKMYVDREKYDTEGGDEYEIEGNHIELEVDSEEKIKLTFNISNICFEELY